MTDIAILYAAKSTADTRGSIPTQLEQGRNLAAQLNLKIVAEYQDEAASAYHGNRGAGLAAAFDHAEECGAAIIVQHTDRLARGDGIRAKHLVEVYLWAQRAGVAIRSVEDDSTFENLLMAAFMGQRNTEDSRRKALSVAAGMRRRFERGLANGGKRPYGYNMVNSATEKGLLEINEQEALIIRRVFEEADAGRSNMAIARDLQAEGVPTMRRNSYWRASTIQHFLKNPVYIGRVTFQKEEGPGAHEPIIDMALWERVRVLRESRRKGKGKGRGRPTAGSHLLTRGFLRCSCGDAMAPRTTRNRREPDRGIYMCLRRWHDVDACSQPPISSADVDAAVFSYFERMGLDLNATRVAVTGEASRKVSESASLLDQAQTEKSRATERLVRVRRDYAEGEISAGDWQSLRAELESELLAASEQLERLESQHKDSLALMETIDAETRLIETINEIRQAISGRVTGAEGLDSVRAALKQIFDRFELTSIPSSRVPADLAWVGQEQLVIRPVVRDDAVERITSDGRTVFARQPLGISSATNDEMDWLLPRPFPSRALRPRGSRVLR